MAKRANSILLTPILQFPPLIPLSDSPWLRPTEKPSFILHHHLPKFRDKEVFSYFWTLFYSFYSVVNFIFLEGLYFCNVTTQFRFDILPVIVPLSLTLFGFLFKAWADAFRSSPEMTGVVSVYEDLRRKGLEFPITELNGYPSQPAQKV